MSIFLTEIQNPSSSISTAGITEISRLPTHPCLVKFSWGDLSYRHLISCPFWPVVLTSLGNSGLCWTVFARNRDTTVPAEGNGDLQTLIYVLVARPRRFPTLSNPVPWQNWMAAYLGYTLQMKTLFRGWPVVVHDTHTRRRRSGPQHFVGPAISRQGQHVQN